MFLMGYSDSLGGYGKVTRTKGVVMDPGDGRTLSRTGVKWDLTFRLPSVSGEVVDQVYRTS